MGLAMLTVVWLVIAAVVVWLVMLVAILVAWRRWRTWSVVTDADTHWWHVDTYVYILGLSVYHCVSVVSHCSTKCHHRKHKAQNHHLLHSC